MCLQTPRCRPPAAPKPPCANRCAPSRRRDGCAPPPALPDRGRKAGDVLSKTPWSRGAARRRKNPQNFWRKWFRPFRPARSKNLPPTKPFWARHSPAQIPPARPAPFGGDVPPLRIFPARPRRAKRPPGARPDWAAASAPMKFARTTQATTPTRPARQTALFSRRNSFFWKMSEAFFLKFGLNPPPAGQRPVD